MIIIIINNYEKIVNNYEKIRKNKKKKENFEESNYIGWIKQLTYNRVNLEKFRKQWDI